jgi:excisionase family DNA binding protein
MDAPNFDALLEELRGIRAEVRQLREAKSPPAGVLLTLDDMAALLRVSTRTLRSWRHEGELPQALEIHGALRWRRADVDAWLAKRGAP